MKRTFATLATAVVLTTLAQTSFADPQCTTEPADKWQDQEAFKAKLEAAGYEIKKFKVTDTNCYELYGKNKDGQKVEIYFNPVDGSVVEEEKED